MKSIKQEKYTEGGKKPTPIQEPCLIGIYFVAANQSFTLSL